MWCVRCQAACYSSLEHFQLDWLRQHKECVPAVSYVHNYNITIMQPPAKEPPIRVLKPVEDTHTPLLPEPESLISQRPRTSVPQHPGQSTAPLDRPVRVNEAMCVVTSALDACCDHVLIPVSSFHNTSPYAHSAESVEDHDQGQYMASAKQNDTSQSSKSVSNASGTAETTVLMEYIRFNFPHDLTSCVTKSDIFPFASGGCGDVYRGKLNMKGKLIDVAIKIHRIYLQNDRCLAERIKRYHRELIVFLQLNHPNILPLLGTVREPSMHFDIPAMVTPWIENGALSSYLELHGNLSIEQRFLLVDGVAHGLEYLHAHHVVHGDLSGSNVLVRSDGTACISDFGSSTLLTAVGGSTFATSSQNRCTVRWMAPELLYLHTVTNPTTQSDVYSFGSIMLQILTGNIPYHHLPRDMQVIFAILKGERPDRSNEETVTNTRWKFIEECWSVDPYRRPSSEEIVKFTCQECSKRTIN